MQRINLFPSPGFLNGIWGSANHTVDNGEMKVLADGGNYSAVTLPATGRDELVLNIEVKDSGNVQAFDSDWKFLANTGEFRNVADWTVKNLRFTPTAGKDLIIGFFPLAGWLTVRRPQLELASTFDTGVGGGAWASGLLLRRHHATRLTPRTGTVMPDDGNEPMHETILDHHPVGRPLGGYHDHSEQARDEISGQRLCERHRRHYLDESVWRPQCKPTCQLRVDRQLGRSDVNVLFRQVRQSDRHRDEYSHLHGCRVSGEQDPARRHRIFHREYDAARLTLTGVVA